MRLSSEYQTTITATAQKIFGAEASVWLFGSRLDDSAKGGDVDLLIKLETPVPDKTALALRYNALLQMQLGLQKFDILVIDPSSRLEPVHQQALSQGVRL